MHGCSSGSVPLVNAEVDSMGGVVDGGAGIGVKASPRRAAIEKAQAELRQEYDVREERRRELEFLEKGGNPLDFKFGNAASLSVQSTSFTDQHLEQFVTSEVKGSFALTESPHGDSFESSGRPGTRTVCEPNSADNLLLFDGENEKPESKKKFIRLGKRNNIAPSEQSSQMDGSQNVRESEDSTIFRPYARRNRSKSNRDGRSSSTDIIQSRGGHGSLVTRGASRDAKGSICDTKKQKDQNVPSISNPKSASSNGEMVSKIVTSDKQLDMELNGVQGVVASRGITKSSLPEGMLQVVASKDGMDNQQPQSSQGGDQQPPVDVDSEQTKLDEVKEPVNSTAIECPPCAAMTMSKNEAGLGPVNGLNNLKVDSEGIPNEVQNSSAALGMKGLDSESSCTQTSLCLDVNNDSDVCTNPRNVDGNRYSTEEKSKSEGLPNLARDEIVKETNDTKAVGSDANGNDDRNSVYHNHAGNVSIVKVEEEIHPSVSGEQNKVNYPPNVEGVENNAHSISGSDKTVGNVVVDDPTTNRENSSTGRPQSSLDLSAHVLSATTLLEKDSASEPEHVTSDTRLKMANKAREDSVLKEARIIEAKRKRIAELSAGTLPLENRRKSHWDYVLEEMAWLANDFAQERLWKITVAAQMCGLVASASRLRFEKQNKYWKLKKVAHTMAKAVMKFWHSAEVILSSDIPCVDLKNNKYDSIRSRCIDGNELSDDKTEETMKASKELEQSSRKSLPLALQGYAVRFLRSTSSPVPPLQAEAPATPEKISDMGITEMSWDDHLTEESLFYTVPCGAMEAYRKSIESHLVQSEKNCSSMREEVETHIYDAVADYGCQDSTYDEDEGETSTYYLPGAFEGSKASKFAQKKRKNLTKSYSARSYEMPTDVPYGNMTTGAQQSILMKRPANNQNVGVIPTKRMRTATRQRVLSPFGAGGTGGVQASAKTDASSGDTNSFQDDQSTMHGGSQIQKSGEVESAADFEGQMPYDYAETSTKPKKKKKSKHLVHKNSYISPDSGGLLISGKGTAYDQGWQLDSTVHSEQRDHFKKRAESHRFDSNGLYGQHNVKRPKIMKQPFDNTFDTIAPMTGSIPSPAASMSTMSNPNKFIKMMGGRDRGRKPKGLKISAGQSDSGCPWSLFEDQALVVLVHDMGPNWELVSDAVNSTLQFKCIFRKPKECKERHKILMDRNASDGADSAEDSGSSQPYPSTLPGIPQGSARQLFQCLQGPMVEDTLKSHFEKIIVIGQKHHYRRSQNDNQDSKQIAPVHNSHVMALSQAFPNNLNGSVLTPLDLCDTTPSSPDGLPLGYQGSHAAGLAMSNQSAVASMHPTGPNSSLQGSSGMVLGSNLPSPSGSLSVSARDGRFGVPRTSLPVDEHQRMQYNQMLSARNNQQPNLSVPGALSGNDRGARINGMGMMPGMNRNMPMARPGFQGLTSSSMLSPGGMLSSNMVGMTSSTLQSGAVSGQGTSMLRPREALHMMRPGHNSEQQRQMMSPELPMQVSQGSSQGIAPFNGLNAAFSNQTTTPPAQTYPVHTQQHQMPPQQPHMLTNPHHPHLQGPNHAVGTQQQAYAIRIAKERQQQRFLQQQQQQQQPQQFGASNSLRPHAQAQPQLPISASLPNNSQIHSQVSSQPVSLPPLTPTSPMASIPSQHHQKHHLQSGLSRNPQTPNSGLTNQMGKQRQRQIQQQMGQQSGRQHPQQRQHAQAQQQAKVLKGIGRGNMLAHQNHSIDPSHLNGLTAAAGSQSEEKGEQIMHSMQNQGPYSGSGLSSVQPSKPLAPQSSNQSQLQQKLYPNQTPSKQLQQIPTHSDSSTQGQVPQLASGHKYPASHQTVPPAEVASNHQQPQPHQKQVNQAQPTAQRVLQQNHHVQSDPPGKAPVDQAQDQQPISNALQTGTTSAPPQACIDPANGVPAAVTPWKASQPVYDSGMPAIATQVAATGTGSEPILPVNKGLGQRQKSGGLLPLGPNTGTQWHQQQPLQQASTPPQHSAQQHYESQEQQPPPPQEQQDQQSPQSHLPPQQPSQQQTQHLQSGQGSLYIRPTTSKLEGTN